MSGDRIAISAFGFVNGAGYGGSSLGGHVNPLPDQPFSELRWDLFSKRPFERYGRLDILSRYAMVAVELLGLPSNRDKQNNIALVMGTQHGCLSVDLDFRESMDQEGGGSPLMFMYTLPNACLGEIAIRHNITGPNLCLVNGDQSGLAAIWEGIRLIGCGEADSCLCLAADALGKWSNWDVGDESSQATTIQGAAYCLLIESARQVENRGSRPLAYIEDSQLKAQKDTPVPHCQAQLSNLVSYLSGAWLGSGHSPGLELNIKLYPQIKILYINRR